MRCNGYTLDEAIHEEVIALIRSSDSVHLKVKSCGVIPVNSSKCDSHSNPLSWRLVNDITTATVIANNRTTNNKPCPVHATPSTSSSSSSSSHSHSRSNPRSHQKNRTNNMDIEEEVEPDDLNLITSVVEEQQVYVSLSAGQGLGCSVVRGPQTFPGIFVQSVRPRGVAEEAGLELGDQIVGLNGHLFVAGFDFGTAIAQIKASSEMTLVVRKKVGTGLFNGSGQYDANGMATKTIHKIRAVVHHQSSSASSSNHHVPHCPKHAPSEADYSMSEVDSQGSTGSKGRCKVHASDEAEAMLAKVRQEEQRLADDRRKLEGEQRQLRDQLDKLDKERYAGHAPRSKVKARVFFFMFVTSGLLLTSLLLIALILLNNQSSQRPLSQLVNYLSPT